MSKSDKDLNALGYKSKVPKFPDLSSKLKLPCLRAGCLNQPKLDIRY